MISVTDTTKQASDQSPPAQKKKQLHRPIRSHKRTSPNPQLGKVTYFLSVYNLLANGAVQMEERLKAFEEAAKAETIKDEKAVKIEEGDDF